MMVQLAEKYVIDCFSPTLDTQVCPSDFGPQVTNLLLQHRVTAANTKVMAVTTFLIIFVGPLPDRKAPTHCVTLWNDPKTCLPKRTKLLVPVSSAFQQQASLPELSN